MFTNEQTDGSIYELESRDVIFLENDFSQRSDINSNLDLFEIEESDTSTVPLQPIPQVDDDHEEFHPNGIEKNIQISQEEPLHHSERVLVGRHFHIETKALALQRENEIFQPVEDDELKTIQEAMSSPASDK